MSSHLPPYTDKERTIIVRWRLDGGETVALEAPLPLDTEDERARIPEVMAALEDALAPFGLVESPPR